MLSKASEVLEKARARRLSPAHHVRSDLLGNSFSALVWNELFESIILLKKSLALLPASNKKYANNRTSAAQKKQIRKTAVLYTAVLLCLHCMHVCISTQYGM